MRQIRVAMVVPRHLVRAAVNDAAAIDLPLSLELRCLLLDEGQEIPKEYYAITKPRALETKQFEEEEAQVKIVESAERAAPSA